MLRVRFLLISLLLHAVLALLLLQLPTPERPREAPGPITGPRTVEVVVMGEARTSGALTATSRREHRTQRSRSQRSGVGALGLDLRLHEFGEVAANQLGSGESTSGSGAGGDAFEVARAMTIEREGQLHPFFGAIWDRLDRGFNYPEDFIQQGIEGTITLQFRAGRDGRIASEVAVLDSPDPFIRAYVQAIVFHALRSPLPRHQWIDENIVLITRFDFELTKAGQGVARADRAQMKNLLLFRRVGFFDAKKVVERFFTRYVPPFVPIPGGFYLNFVHAYKMIQEHTQPDPDKLRAQRLELLKEKWERLITAEKPT